MLLYVYKPMAICNKRDFVVLRFKAMTLFVLQFSDGFLISTKTECVASLRLSDRSEIKYQCKLMILFL